MEKCSFQSFGGEKMSWFNGYLTGYNKGYTDALEQQLLAQEEVETRQAQVFLKKKRGRPKGWSPKKR